MRVDPERQLVVLMISVSLALTGVTVWAVAAQGRALYARERSDLVSAAQTAAARNVARWRADLDRALDEAGRSWTAGGADEFDAWTAAHPMFVLTATRGDTAWAFHPYTPLAEPLPQAESTEDEEEERTDLLEMMRDFRSLAGSPDPLTRAGALLAWAAAEQQLGHPLAAARIFADAANLLRATPHLARFAFRAEVSRIESLLAAGDYNRAAETMRTFLRSLTVDHPGRLGADELALLTDQMERLADHADEELRAALATLRQRAVRREDIAESVRQLLAARALQGPREQGASEILDMHTSGGEPIVVVVFEVADGVRGALVMRAAELLARYWLPIPEDAGWAVVLPDRATARAPLAALGREFAGAEIVLTPETTARLQRLWRRQLGVVGAVGLALVGAWAAVIWMMMRVLGRQRELARLQARFVADVSHELKTPLALIRLLAETLADGRVRDAKRITDYHETITRESERLTMLLDNILDLGRIQSGRKRYEFGDCDVGEIARQAWTLFERQFENEGFTTELNVEPRLPKIRADAMALQQVIVNLLQNAYRYAGSEKFIRLSVRREGYVIMINVEDHGIGMSRTELNRLGESFYRAEDARVRQQRGTGLGLSIANHIVTAHGGKIEVQSRPGEGSTFTVWIPFEPPSDRDA